MSARSATSLENGLEDVEYGELRCKQCASKYPILAGVAILVEDPREYILMHVKGIAKLVPEKELPKDLILDFREAKQELQAEHIEEDLEAERVVSLYLMNHYLKAGAEAAWWKPEEGPGSPLMNRLIQDHWDQGPFSVIRHWSKELRSLGAVIELGCGVGGLYKEVRSQSSRYLGVDSSFASIALARHFALGAKYPGKVRIPGDLLQGSVSKAPEILAPQAADGTADFVVGDVDALPVARGEWDASIALNAIDMVHEPESFAQTQSDLVKKGGVVIQSCPYIWHPEVSAHLRKLLPKTVRDSAQAVEWLYHQAGLSIQKRVEHLPWLFYKHLRQLEIYSVHIFMAMK